MEAYGEETDIGIYVDSTASQPHWERREPLPETD
jgi:hypothetical protein